MRLLTLSLALVGACQAKVQTNPNGDDASTDSSSTDTPVDAEILGAWGPPQKIGPAATTGAEDDGTLSNSGLELVFALVEPGDNNRKHLYYAQRGSLADPFGPITRLPFDLTGTSEETPRFSADDKTLYFASNRAPTLGGLDIWQVGHPALGAVAASWAAPQPMANVSSANVDKWFMPCGAQGYYVVATNGHLAEGTIGGGAAIPIVPLDSTGLNQTETGTFLTPDCKTIFFASNRVAPTQMFTATRANATDPWPGPSTVVDFATLGGNQSDPWISPNNRIFVFVSDAAGSNDVYISTR